MADKEIVLDVRHLQQYFSNGIGKNKVVVKAVDDVNLPCLASLVGATQSNVSAPFSVPIKISSG